MAVQTSVEITHAAATAGMVADLQLSNVVSKVNNDTATLPYGIGVITSGEDGMALAVDDADANDKFVGVVKENSVGDDQAGVAQEIVGGVVTAGVVWVYCIGTVTKDQPVYLRVGSTNRGRFANILGAGVTLGSLLANAKFLTGGTNELVKISLNIGG